MILKYNIIEQFKEQIRILINLLLNEKMKFSMIGESLNLLL